MLFSVDENLSNSVLIPKTSVHPFTQFNLQENNQSMGKFTDMKLNDINLELEKIKQTRLGNNLSYSIEKGNVTSIQDSSSLNRKKSEDVTKWWDKMINSITVYLTDQYMYQTSDWINKQLPSEMLLFEGCKWIENKKEDEKIGCASFGGGALSLKSMKDYIYSQQLSHLINNEEEWTIALSQAEERKKQISLQQPSLFNNVPNPTTTFRKKRCELFLKQSSELRKMDVDYIFSLLSIQDTLRICITKNVQEHLRIYNIHKEELKQQYGSIINQFEKESQTYLESWRKLQSEYERYIDSRLNPFRHSSVPTSSYVLASTSASASAPTSVPASIFQVTEKKETSSIDDPHPYISNPDVMKNVSYGSTAQLLAAKTFIHSNSVHFVEESYYLLDIAKKLEKEQMDNLQQFIISNEDRLKYLQSQLLLPSSSVENKQWLEDEIRKIKQESQFRLEEEMKIPTPSSTTETKSWVKLIENFHNAASEWKQKEREGLSKYKEKEKIVIEEICESLNNVRKYFIDNYNRMVEIYQQRKEETKKLIKDRYQAGDVDMSGGHIISFISLDAEEWAYEQLWTMKSSHFLDYSIIKEYQEQDQLSKIAQKNVCINFNLKKCYNDFQSLIQKTIERILQQ